MSKIRHPGTEGPISDRTPADALHATIGPQVLDVLDVAYRARLPVLMEGPTGIGKSQIAAEFARRAQIGFAVLDLSLLEPPDLVGLPVIRDGSTHYAPPSELPQGGAGILMLEELNRAEIPVMQPALQLLSARRLHAYELPPGWSCVAAINPEDGDYQVHALDPALRSRFLQLSVRAETASWLPWATAENLHPAIVRTVAAHADAFEHASPRGWTYASAALTAMARDQLERPDLVRLTLRGYLPTAWALRVVAELEGLPEVPEFDPEQIWAGDGAATLKQLAPPMAKAGQTDRLAMLAGSIRRAVGREGFARAVAGGYSLDAFENALSALPGDLRDRCLEDAVRTEAAEAWLAALGTDRASLAAGYASSRLRADLGSWRDAMRLHRVALVVAAAERWLAAHARDDGAAIERAAPHLEALADDARVVGRDLRRALRTHLPEGR